MRKLWYDELLVSSLPAGDHHLSEHLSMRSLAYSAEYKPPSKYTEEVLLVSTQFQIAHLPEQHRLETSTYKSVPAGDRVLSRSRVDIPGKWASA